MARRPALLPLLALAAALPPVVAEGFAPDAPAPTALVALGLWTGYRELDVSWRTLATPAGAAPAAPTTADWRDLRAVEAGASLTWEAGPLQLRGALGYGRIFAGRNSLTAYTDDSRGVQLDRSENHSERGWLLDATLAAGWVLQPRPWLRLTPEAGYAWQLQHLTLTDGDQVVPASGPYDGLDSSYDARWSGPWAGLEATWRARPRLAFSARFAYHWADFHAQGDFNLRSDLAHPDSFDQDAGGRGLVGAIGLSYTSTPGLTWWLQLEIEHWRAWGGTNHTHDALGGQADTTLDEARSDGHALLAGLRWGF